MDHLYCDYDENLSHNAFFRLLQSEHKIICDTAPLENWVICVPRAATISAAQLANPDYLLAHVLVPHDELPQTHFTNLLGVDIRLERKRLTNSTATTVPSSAVSSASVSSSSTSSSASSSSTCDDSIGSDGGGGPIESYVLFEEVFYTLQLMKYKVWCIESALLPDDQKRPSGSQQAGAGSNGDGSSCANAPQPAGIYVVRNVKDAVDIIWNETRSNVVFRRIDQTCAAFCQRPTRPSLNGSGNSGSSGIDATDDTLNTDGADGHAADTTVESLAALLAATETLYDQCLRILMQNRRLKEKCRQDVHIYRIVRIALETYVMNVVAERVLDGIGLALRAEAEAFNRTVRSLAECSSAFCGVSAKHAEVVASVRVELLRMEEYSTTIEKLACLRRSINATSGQQGVRMLSVDDLIPILAFVIIKSGLTHWTATQKFIESFVFNDLSDAGIDKNGADSFLAATLEAALTYIGGLGENQRTADMAAATTSVARQTRRSKFAKQSEFVEYVFEAVRRSDDRELLRLFGADGDGGRTTEADAELDGDGDVYLPASDSVNDSNDDDADADDDDTDNADEGADDSFILIVDTPADTARLCHPLCACSRCAGIAKARQLNVNTCNAHGMTAVHVAAQCGLPPMINVLLALGADVTLADERGYTALHWAAQRGHQGAVLLLLHAGADVNARTVDSLCTPLHLASLGGHDGCVKAILYAAEQRRVRVEKNCLNRAGDTAVHLAARWGFAGIVETLLEYGVKVDTPNRDGRTASESAHNSRVRELLQNTFVMVDGASDGGSATGDWDEVDVIGGRVEPPFRGCISEQMMLGEGGLGGGGNFVRRSSENDKVIAAIRNGDTKLANYFLGRPAEEEPVEGGDQTLASDICHPLCTCLKCVAAKNRLTTSTPSASPQKVANINGQNAEGITMLQAAAAQPGNADLVRYLLGQKASLKCRTPTLQSALHLAVLSGDCDNAEQLLRVAGEYELNVQDADGNTALHLAVRKGSESMVDLLLRHEPWLDARNNARQTAADIAREGFLFNIAQMLAQTAGEQEARGTEL